MSIPTSLTAFVASLQSYQEVAGGTIADRIAALRDRLKYLEDQRGDDHDANELRCRAANEAARIALELVMAANEAERGRTQGAINERFWQDREAIEQQIDALRALNDTIINGVVEEQPKPNFAAGLDDSLTGTGDTVTMKWADGSTSALNVGMLSETTKAMPQVADSPVVLDDVHVRPRDPKDGAPIWRDKKPITEMTDAEIDDAVGVAPGETERMVPRFAPPAEDEPYDRFSTVDGKNATPKPKSLPVPAGIYYSDGNFYDAITHKGQGDMFYSIWRNRCEDFPRDPRRNYIASGQAGEAD